MSRRIVLFYCICLLFTASNNKSEIAFVSDSSTQFTESQSKIHA